MPPKKKTIDSVLDVEPKKPRTYHEYEPDTWEWAAMRIIVANELDMHTGTRTKYEQLFDSDMWVPLARTAWAEIVAHGIDWTAEDQVDLLARKQHDYGCDNILKFGEQGIRVRLWDKIARYNNLRKRGVDPENESLNDTLTDIIGYTVLYMMVKNGTFTLPLTDDKYPF